MKKIRMFFGSFRTKVTLFLIFTLFFVMGLSNLMIYKFSLEAQFNQLRERLIAIAQTSALMIDTETLLQVPLNREGIRTEAYKSTMEKLRDVKNALPEIKYIYTMTKTEQPGIWQFIVDPDPVLMKGKKWRATAFPGDKYDASRFPEMLKGYTMPSADTELMIDEWGASLSGYAPVRDKAGRAVALLGVDMSARDVYLSQKQLQFRMLLVILIGIMFSVILGIFISNRITERIEKLTEGTRRIADEDLDYHVSIKGHDEISELADSFNKMASSLSESKKKLQEYFYRVVQALVRILEAKDHYTCGHSERVAKYAKDIALSMGFSQEKAEMVGRAAELHDIGKLAVHESILNKKGPLNEEEWQLIKQHPVTGEEALKPILIDEELLSMIRSHHERYDGTGYPDKIKGDKINIFAQIVSVADSYDAMTSPRAYRPAMSKEAAIEEIKKNSGTQFNTQVVKAFLRSIGER